MYKIIYSPKAKKDMKFWGKNSKTTFEKVRVLINEISEHPYIGNGFPKRLVTDRTKWARQINEKDRLVYRVDNDTIVVDILSARGHYDDH